MKQTESNPLRVELARMAGALPHPDEDVLTAFAEGALLERERESVMEHLAGCSECREILSLTAAAAPEATVLHVVPTGPTQKRWLPWLAAAAAVVLVSSAALIYVRGREINGLPQQSPEIAVQGIGRREPDSARPDAPAVQSAEPMPGLATSEAATGNSETVGRTHWRINEAGHAERSLGNGTWQAVLPNDSARIRVISVSGSDVWLGGEKLHLCHSNDDGATWHCEQLPTKNSSASVLAHIRFRDLQTGVVEATDGTRWETGDGGRTWR
ncbi:hypothetical protein HDF16_003473 [Granulicella aggregans]|uniref:Putative zinc-finger domain-containing protein n=1 Tax=Granulicella aggregans TaxID=474949 RepID=A0A7W8E4Z7_9BACT|nr:hypothetical protein [Granulicella aggregans]